VLTDREKRLLRRLADGKTDEEIAREIGGTKKQIATQRKRLLGRLGLCSDDDIKGAAKSLARWPYRKSGTN
jgi:DNA-binding CsgD family transcriptional regulator